MKLTKNIFFFFCFLFTVTLVGAKNTGQSCNSAAQVIQSATGLHQDELQLAKEGLSVCFRLTENAPPSFRNSGYTHALFDAFYHKQILFSKQSYSNYKVNRLNQLDSHPLYIHHRRFRI